MSSRKGRSDGIPKVQEMTISVMISEKMEDFGISNISLLNLGKVPDIYLVLKGCRVIIEIKEDGQLAALKKQMKERLNLNLCELIIGLEYPTELVSDTFASLTSKNIKKRIDSTTFTLHALVHGEKDSKSLVQGLKIRVIQLPELLSRFVNETMPDKEIEFALTRIRETISNFSINMSSLDNTKDIAKNLREAIEFG